MERGHRFNIQWPQVYKSHSAFQPTTLSSSVHHFTMSQYGKTKALPGGDEFVAQTRARLETIKTHLETAPRSGKLNGKICVITGAGSLKGIGSVRSPVSASHIPHLPVGELLRYCSLMKVDTTHIPLSTLIQISGPRSRRSTPVPLRFRRRQSPRVKGDYSKEIPRRQGDIHVTKSEKSC